jgi:hypothetical protein
MKTLIKISVCLNLGLAGCLIFMLLDGQRRAAHTPQRMVAETPPPVKEQVAVVSPQKIIQAEPKPFRWSQLDAEDYHVYVKNLRAIGCPEPTVRAIVTADVDMVYRQRSRELEQKLDDLNNGSWVVQFSSFDEKQALQAELQQLPGEEMAKVDDYLGLKHATEANVVPMVAATQSGRGNNLRSSPSGNADAVADSRVTTSSDEVVATTGAGGGASGQTASFLTPLSEYQLPPKPKSASLPIVFQPVDQAAVNMDQSQQQAVNDLRQQFIASVSSSSQNPADPAYQQTWQQAQTQADQMTIVQLGYNAYFAYWVAQYQQSLANQQSTPQ